MSSAWLPGRPSRRPTQSLSHDERLNASGGSQPRNDEGASRFARRGKNAEAFLILC